MRREHHSYFVDELFNKINTTDILTAPLAVVTDCVRFAFIISFTFRTNHLPWNQEIAVSTLVLCSASSISHTTVTLNQAGNIAALFRGHVTPRTSFISWDSLHCQTQRWSVAAMGWSACQYRPNFSMHGPTFKKTRLVDSSN